MGKLARRYIRTSVLTVGKNIEGGTWDSPIAVGIPSVIACQFVHMVFIAGTSEGGFFGTKGSITTGNLNLIGVHGKTTVLTGKNIGSGRMDGVYSEVEVLGTGQLTGIICGIRTEVYIESTAVSIGGDVYGLYVNNYVDKTPTGEYGLIRLEQNGAGVLTEVINVAIGAAQVSWFLSITGGAKNAWDSSTVVTGKASAGFLKVQMPGGAVRYIPLYGP